MIKYILGLIYKNPNKLALGRWGLKHKCKSEDIIVYQANRDHCGDKICGDMKDYKPEVKDYKPKDAKGFPK